MIVRYNKKLLQILKRKYPKIFFTSIKRISSGIRLIEQGDEAFHVYVILDGIVKVYQHNKDGRSFILEFLSAGELIGEIEYLQKIPNLATVEAINEVHLLKLKYDVFDEILTTDMDINNVVLKVLSKRVLDTSRRSAFLQLNTIKESKDNLSELIKEYEFLFTRQELADYFGTSIRNLNRVLSKLQ